MTIIERATRIAITAHWNQTRKSDNFPYIFHPFSVALMLQKHGFSDLTIAAALLHDVIEDTEVTAEEIRSVVGDEVLAIVQTVTEDKSLDWEERRHKYIQTVASGSEEAKAVSTADKLHNLSNMLEGEAEKGEAFWTHFSRGREAQVGFHEQFLAAVSSTWQHPLLEVYRALVARFAGR